MIYCFAVEQKHSAAIARLKEDFERRLKEAAEKEKVSTENHSQDFVPKSQLEQLKVYSHRRHILSHNRLDTRTQTDRIP